MKIKILIAIVTFIILYLQEYQLVKYAQSNPDEHPRKVIFGFFKKLYDEIRPNMPEHHYDPYIVMENENGNLNADSVNTVFQKFHDIFDVFYFVNFQDTGNRVLYYFTAKMPKIPTDEQGIWRACCGYADEIMHRVYHKKYSIFVFPQDFDCVTVGIDNMTLALAKNKEGAEENRIVREQTRLRFEKENADNNDNSINIHESWDSKEVDGK